MKKKELREQISLLQDTLEKYERKDRKALLLKQLEAFLDADCYAQMEIINGGGVVDVTHASGSHRVEFVGEVEYNGTVTLVLKMGKPPMVYCGIEDTMNVLI